MQHNRLDMEVNVKQAQKMFFSKSSFEMIYFEAFANALDAGATTININIKLSDKEQKQNLCLTIEDNGCGFTDEHFRKFSKLLDVEERTHKGLGRLVYLCYFDNVHIESVYDVNKKRIFDYDENFDGKFVIQDCQEEHTGTVLKMYSFSGYKLGKNEYINPTYIKDALLENFYMKFYKAKNIGFPICVKIEANIAGNIKTENITEKDLPNFEVMQLKEQVDIFNKIDLYYYVKELETLQETKVITAIAVDDRSQKVDIIAEENFPPRYQMIFLLISESFHGNTDGARLNLTLETAELNKIKAIFRDAIAKVIKNKIPKLAKHNKEKVNYLKTTYPYLTGYFDINEIGYASQTDILKKAQERLFREQKEILGAGELTKEQFEKSLNLSARALAQYILFRQGVIERLKRIDPKNLEEDIHNIIAPKRTEFNESNFLADLYKNNVWVLDDKFMSYRTVLSEAEMTNVINVLTSGEETVVDDDRPDIVLYFSADPTSEESEKVDVVIVELKRLGLSPERNSDVEIQLENRAIKLSSYYNNRIQRIWYYGIVDLHDDYVRHLRTAQFVPLFSKGKVFYKFNKVYLDSSTDDVVIANTYIMDFSAMVADADIRNETFLKILKEQFDIAHNEMES